MNNDADFRAGDVLRIDWDERPIRVMMADNVEVFYDALFPEVGWNLARARTAIYYRSSTSFLRSTAQCIRTEPLTDKELARHRPDLPIRILRSGEADWRNPLVDWPKINTNIEVKTNRLALVPFGPNGAPQRAVVVEADDGKTFRGNELLELAHSVQTAKCSDVRGVGLYRSGISAGIPSYYLWGAVDKAGHAA
ncbi:hypothetical protein [Sphingomonas flavescens]|uniref:hypothetical protein n=1 Tax=Sphingomonas flavescens TaxID=3132797 RepID=UPI002803FA94|nr:hypothetical protein [Sphingomonas limnosediminicola]